MAVCSLMAVGRYCRYHQRDHFIKDGYISVQHHHFRSDRIEQQLLHLFRVPSRVDEGDDLVRAVPCHLPGPSRA